MRTLIGFMLLVSTSVFATEWADLELGSSYKLAQSFQLKQLERSGSSVNVEAGQVVVLRDRVPVAVPGFPLYLYVFDYKSCPGPAMKTDQEIIPVNNTSPLVEVGVELEEGCVLNVFLESKDYYTNSLFE